MKINIKRQLLSLLIVPALVLSVSAVVAPVSYVSAADNKLTLGGGASSAQGDDQTSCLFGTEAGCDGKTPLFKTITNVLLFIIGAVSVIMLILGGFRYTISQGDSTAIQNAKNTILYAVIGIVVAILAFAVVNFVITNFAANSTD